MLKSPEGLRIIDPKIITEVDEVMASPADGNMVIRCHKFDQPITLEEIAANLGPNADWGTVSQFVKGQIELAGQAVPFTSKAFSESKVFIDAQRLSPEEILQKRGLARWMAEKGIENIVKTRHGAITEFGKGDYLISSKVLPTVVPA